MFALNSLVSTMRAKSCPTAMRLGAKQPWMSGEMIRDVDGKLRPGQGWELEVTDKFRNPLYVISVRAGRR
jgi:hypothetical protein